MNNVSYVSWRHAKNCEGPLSVPLNILRHTHAGCEAGDLLNLEVNGVFMPTAIVRAAQAASERDKRERGLKLMEG